MKVKVMLNTCLLFLSVLYLISMFGVGCGTSTSNRSLTLSASQSFLEHDMSLNMTNVHLVKTVQATSFSTISFAAVSEFDEEYGVHGNFERGLPVVLFNESGYPVYTGTTGNQEFYDNLAGGITIPYSEIDTQSRIPDEQKFAYAIVGELESYEIVPLWPSQGYLSTSTATSIANAVRNPSLLEGCLNPEVFRFSDGEREGFLVSYEKTGSMSNSLLRTYILVVDNSVFEVAVQCGLTPILFKANGELFVAARYIGYHCGECGQYIINLRETGGVWSNFDWSD